MRVICLVTLLVSAEERGKIMDAKNEVAERMFSCFCIADSGSINEELLVHVLSTSKGKNMLARCVTQLRSEHSRAILYHLLGNMATIIAHDKKHEVAVCLCLFHFCLTVFLSDCPSKCLSILFSIFSSPATASTLRTSWLCGPQRHDQHDAGLDEEPCGRPQLLRRSGALPRLRSCQQGQWNTWDANSMVQVHVSVNLKGDMTAEMHYSDSLF